MIPMKSSSDTTSCSTPSSENRTPKDGDSDIDDSTRAEKVCVGSQSQHVSVDKANVSVTKPTRISWQVTCWEDDCDGRRLSRRSESSGSSFYHSLNSEIDTYINEICINETTDNETKPRLEKIKRKSMQKCLEEDEESFANSLRFLELEAGKGKRDNHSFYPLRRKNSVGSEPKTTESKSKEALLGIH